MSNQRHVPYHEQVADRVLDALRQGTAPWLKPWDASNGPMLPHNPVSGSRYRGLNAVNLLSHGAADPRWLTFKQAKAQGWHVKKGERGTRIEFWKFYDDKPRPGSTGSGVTESVKLDKPKVFYATVFNAAQIEGVPPLAVVAQTWTPDATAEKILAGSGADIRHDQHDGAFYRPSTDSIHLPAQSQFGSPAQYYSTAIHELGHWTGHGSRLGRDLSHPFGSVEYAREELRAELASLMVADQTGIPHDPGNHTAYIASWIRLLEDDPRELARAARDADRIADCVIAMEHGQAVALAQHRARYGEVVATPADRSADLVKLTDALNKHDWWFDLAENPEARARGAVLASEIDAMVNDLVATHPEAVAEAWVTSVPEGVAMPAAVSGLLQANAPVAHAAFSLLDRTELESALLSDSTTHALIREGGYQYSQTTRDAAGGFTHQFCDDQGDTLAVAATERLLRLFYHAEKTAKVAQEGHPPVREPARSAIRDTADLAR